MVGTKGGQIDTVTQVGHFLTGHPGAVVADGYLHLLAPIPLVQYLGSVGDQAVNTCIFDTGHVPDEPCERIDDWLGPGAHVFVR
jgi:hypothetical protein